MSNLKPKSTKDYARPCRGAALMDYQNVEYKDSWPTLTTFPPRLAGLKGCHTGRKNDTGEDLKEAGPAQAARDAS